jgi:SOS-response transcriptional repressor LexA
MKDLTKLQNKILTYIKLQVKSNGFQPSVTSVREMAEYFDVYPTAITNNLNLIEAKGYIKQTGKARAIEILKVQ